MHIPEGPILVGVAGDTAIDWMYPDNFPVEDSAIPGRTAEEQLEYVNDEHQTPESLAQFAAIAVVFGSEPGPIEPVLLRAGFEEVNGAHGERLRERLGEGVSFASAFLRNIPHSGQDI